MPILRCWKYLRKVSELYPGSKLIEFDDSEIEMNYKNNMKVKHKYAAEIVYFVWYIKET